MSDTFCEDRPSLCGECGGVLVDHVCTACGTRHGSPGLQSCASTGVKIVAHWDDGEEWYFETAANGDHDPANGSFAIDVADEVAASYFDAQNTMARLSREIPAAAGLHPERGTLRVCCDEFTSDHEPRPDLGRDWRRCDTCGFYADEHGTPLDNGDLQDCSAPLEHIKADEPDATERKNQMYWCRRCGRALETFDGRELAGKAKPCRVVKVTFR